MRLNPAEQIRILLINRLKFIVIILFLCGGFIQCSKSVLIPPIGFEIDNNSDSIVFAVIGDYGYAGENEEAVANLVKSWEPDFIITVGDNNYPSGELKTLKENVSDYYYDFIYNHDAPSNYVCMGKAYEEKENRFFPCPGNHDVNPTNDLIPYLNFFTLPGEESYYAFSWGPVNFYSLNSLPSNVDDQKNWLEGVMDSTSAKFNIVYFHHSPYGVGRHSQSEKMRWDFDGMGVDAVITGHDHIYARIEKTGEENMHYIVNGLGGKSKYSCNKSNIEADSFDIKCFADDFGAMRCYASEEKLVMEFFTVNSSEEAIDQLIITK